MKYIRVEWKHLDPDDPITIYSELDEQQWELRKVELFRDGHKGFADESREVAGTGLGLEPWPDLLKLGAEPEFDIKHITKNEFERVWEEALREAR